MLFFFSFASCCLVGAKGLQAGISTLFLPLECYRKKQLFCSLMGVNGSERDFMDQDSVFLNPYLKAPIPIFNIHIFL